VNKKLLLIFLLIFLSNCSLDTKSGLWDSDKTPEVEQKDLKKEVFKKAVVKKIEINEKLKIKTPLKFIKNNLNTKSTNNDGLFNYNNEIKKKSKYKFSRIKNLKEFDLETIVNGQDIIFFSSKGTILKFDKNFKIIWKKNYYSKNEKKLEPKLFFASNENVLIVVDNIAKYYAIDIDSGKLLWSKTNIISFNSEIKIFKDNFFVVDYDDTLRCYSLKDGKELWNYQADKSLIKSSKKLSLVISDDKVIFNSMSGDITAVNIDDGNLEWLASTVNDSVRSRRLNLKMASLVASTNSILSSSNNSFYSIDIKSGVTNWKQNINSSLRPTIIKGIQIPNSSNDFIFTITDDGFLVILDYLTGEIVRKNYLLNDIKKSKKKKIIPTGFIVGLDSIYLSTNKGKLLTVNINNGKIKNLIKVHNNKITRPFIITNNLYVIKDDAIVKLN